MSAETAVTEHPSDVELERYARGGLAAADLLRIDDHLAVCPACRTWTFESAGAGRRLSTAAAAVRRDLATPAIVPFPARLVAAAPGRKRAAIYAAAAASVILAMTWAAREKPQVPQPPLGDARSAAVVRPAPEPPTLTADERSAIDEAIATGEMPKAVVPKALASASGILMGQEPTALSFGPVRPAGTLVDDDRPQFEWRAAGDGSEYRVAIFSETFHRIAQSGWQPGTRWTPDRPLARGQVYAWQVTARQAGRETTAPSPPQPEAKFMVTSADQHRQLAEMRTRSAGSHQGLAVLLARAGLFEEAERELAIAHDDDPRSASVSRLQESLRSRQRR